jgi:hypothetical protein
MKGYYTVRAEAPGYSQGQRIALEAAFAREVEAVVGGVDRMTELCLEAASEGERGGARASLLHASKKAETGHECSRSGVNQAALPLRRKKQLGIDN